ncbi:MAG: beta-N-acetylhexosaminidase [Prevotella sp.]|nr:beta-N-acetylhexosaminidase [Prevotella sp.]
MNRFLGMVMAVVLALNLGAVTTDNVAKYDVVPLPRSIVMQKGEGFALNSQAVIVAKDVSLARNAEFLREYLKEEAEIEAVVQEKAVSGRTIVLQLNPKMTETEGYRIIVKRKEVTVEGKTPQGVFYGVQTLRKSLAGLKGEAVLPAAIVEDAPRFGYRGMHLDVARHFFGVEFVKKYLDVMALHNMNRLHWHLTDDQGWRVAIDRYPRLAKEGSVRNFTVLGRNSPVDDGKPYGGYYTKDELREIVRYAQERYITVIPEIDMPGHMLGALKAYPELGCTGGPYEVEGHWGIFDDILCAGKEETFNFVEGVLTELMEVFPSEYIHIGGDEAPKVRWAKCPRCQQRIKDEGLKADGGHTAEARLQGYFTKRVEAFLNKHGRKLIGWDELMESDVNASATIMSWRGVEGGLAASQKGHDVIMSPTSHCYFDYYQTEDYEWSEPFSFAHVVTVEKTYSLDPAPETLSAEARSHILGAQANLWTEYILSESQALYQVLPRMGALSEVQWMDPARKNFKEWVERERRLTNIYKAYGWPFAKHVFKVKSEESLAARIGARPLGVE